MKADKEFLDELKITDPTVREALIGRMVLGRGGYRSMIALGVGFTDPDNTKVPGMMQRAIDASREA